MRSKITRSLFAVLLLTVAACSKKTAPSTSAPSAEQLSALLPPPTDSVQMTIDPACNIIGQPVVSRADGLVGYVDYNRAAKMYASWIVFSAKPH